jgi:hypothetical protein
LGDRDAFLGEDVADPFRGAAAAAPLFCAFRIFIFEGNYCTFIVFLASSGFCLGRTPSSGGGFFLSARFAILTQVQVRQVVDGKFVLSLNCQNG